MRFRAALATNECAGLVGTLLAAGASVHVRNRNGATALHHAASTDGGAAEQLCHAGADVDTRTGQTPLAADTFNRRCAELLLDHWWCSLDCGGAFPLHAWFDDLFKRVAAARALAAPGFQLLWLLLWSR